MLLAIAAKETNPQIIVQTDLGLNAFMYTRPANVNPQQQKISGNMSGALHHVTTLVMRGPVVLRLC